jgi:hypothetical protein
MIFLLIDCFMAPTYKLLDWIVPDCLVWFNLCSNPNAVGYIESYPYKVYWGNIWTNPNAVHLFDNSKSLNANWMFVSKNAGAISLLSQNIERVFWPWFFTYNAKCIELVYKCPDGPHWIALCYNESADVFSYLRSYLDTLDRYELERMIAHCSGNRYACSYIMGLDGWESLVDYELFSANSDDSAVNWLIAHPHTIVWSDFSSNVNRVALEFLYDYHKDHIDWSRLSGNPSAIWILERHKDMICWDAFSGNPSIFV